MQDGTDTHGYEKKKIMLSYPMFDSRIIMLITKYLVWLVCVLVKRKFWKYNRTPPLFQDSKPCTEGLDYDRIYQDFVPSSFDYLLSIMSKPFLIYWVHMDVCQHMFLSIVSSCEIAHFLSNFSIMVEKQPFHIIFPLSTNTVWRWISIMHCI